MSSRLNSGGLRYQPHRFVSAPNGKAASFSLVQVEEVNETVGPSNKKQKASGLTPDTADALLDPALDMLKFSDYLVSHPDIVSDPMELLRVLKVDGCRPTCICDS
jgi:hypothetical protein